MIKKLSTGPHRAATLSSRLALVGFLALQLLVQAWWINFPAGEALARPVPQAAKITIAQLDADDDHRIFKLPTPPSLAPSLQSLRAIAEEPCSRTGSRVSPPQQRPIYQEISVLLI